ncbi:hypothetical protein M407DRAFT_25239 [Tulasnella calospora MUT 4182]|uniref:mannan endo-1,4-beta-mannosidase n=1 Tax=Tulasnella calospora MUT 4182 TaxID=1051891 RepID=A0A0C3QGI0_9AGAM|nr:hypothetical protein M407DRAFT_25239 [Tulasnella calospora MUT 4182]
MRSASLFTAGLLALSNVIAASSPTEVQQRSAHKRWNDAPGFVYAEDGKFKIDGKDFFFAGTTAYWLTQVQINDDITKTLDDIAADDLEVVRIWGFREVVGETNDDPATYTQQWVNGEQKCNQAGIDRIKFILDEAQKRGIFVQIALTNNWAPNFPANATAKFPPGYLSNSYGGIDTYVQQVIKPDCDRDAFYTDETVKNAYKKWLSCIIPQISSHKALFAWELANDPRCKGADGTTTSGNCNAQTITRWTADTAKFVKSLDPNHMAASGDGGFYCTDCEKLFPRNLGKRDGKRTGYLTTAMVREQNKARRKATSSLFNNKRENDGDIGPSYDGSLSIDTEDILGIPEIDLSTFQFFPDQNTYGPEREASAGPPPGGAGGDNFEHTLEVGLQWIDNHAQTAQAFGKPSHMDAMGLVDDDSRANFVPFSSTFVTDTVTDPETDPKTDGYYVRMVKRAQTVSTNTQQSRAYTTWADRAVSSGINGITNYQRGQTNLSGREGAKRSIEERQSSNRNRNSGSDSNGFSPDDGYRITREGTKTIFKNTGKKQKRKSGRDSG